MNIQIMYVNSLHGITEAIQCTQPFSQATSLQLTWIHMNQMLHC